MPWQETVSYKLRKAFVEAHLEGPYRMTDLCARFGVARKTGYKWIRRFEQGGYPALEDRSRAPLSSPQAMPKAVAELLLEARLDHPHWGSRKILAFLQQKHRRKAWPAASTVCDLFRRHGLIRVKRKRRKHTHPWSRVFAAAFPNAVWTIDFKGHFKTKDGLYCYPLTVVDHLSRYILDIRGLPSVKSEVTWPVLERLFREYGLPDAIRSDNGAPFGSNGLHGPSKMSARLLCLGIQIQRSRPGCPQDNGAHERMHKTLKKACCLPPKANRQAQQRAFNSFRDEFDEIRPHQALDDQTPASLYERSRRVYHGTIPELEYPGHYLSKRVTASGEIRFKKHLWFISTALHGHRIGMLEVEDGIWDLYLNDFLLAKLDERNGTVHP